MKSYSICLNKQQYVSKNCKCCRHLHMFRKKVRKDYRSRVETPKRGLPVKNGRKINFFSRMQEEEYLSDWPGRDIKTTGKYVYAGRF